MASIDDLLNERKQKAKEHGISEKARKIAEFLGTEYMTDSTCYEKKSLNYYFYCEQGRVFKDDKLKIKAYHNTEQQKFVEIFMREKLVKSFLCFKIPEYLFDKVYKETDGNVNIFKREDEWLGHLDKIYKAALKLEKEATMAGKKAQPEQNERELKDNFGIK